MSEHGGTHIDAPIHFGKDQHTLDMIPLYRLVAPAVVVDVRDAVAKDHLRDLLKATDKRALRQAQGERIRDCVELSCGWRRMGP